MCNTESTGACERACALQTSEVRLPYNVCMGPEGEVCRMVFEKMKLPF